jgi:hypothetical protein
MPKNEERESGKYCVYLEKCGRTEPGIYPRKVRIVGDIAFVLPERGSQADILPAINVFEKKEDAEKYMTGTGIEMWVVGQDYNDDTPEMFRGKVIRAVHEVYRGPRKTSTLIMRPDGTTFRGNYGCKTYTSKKEAEADFSHRWHDKMKHAQKDLEGIHAIIEKLKRNQPRSKKRAEPVEYKEYRTGLEVP